MPNDIQQSARGDIAPVVDSAPFDSKTASKTAAFDGVPAARALGREPLRRAMDFEIDRRSAFKALLGAAASTVLLGIPEVARAASATKETTEALANAETQLDELQKRLDDISNQYQKIAEAQDKTMGQIEDVTAQIDDLKAQIAKKQEELKRKQGVLGERVADSYKSGDNRMLSLLLSSASFDELINKGYYISKVNESDQQAIQDVRAIQEGLAKQQASLEQQKSELESLKEEQAQQMKDMQGKKDEAQKLVESTSQEVKDLMAKRDAEYLASVQAEEAARKAAEEAARRAAQANRGTTYIPGNGQASASAGGQQAVVSACGRTPSPGAGFCAAWVTNVFQNAGIGYFGGNADDMYASWCTSSSKADLKVGMIVAVSTHPHTMAGRQYGHVGIYVGNNTVMHNIGPITTQDIDSWIAFYGQTVTPRWGWLGGVKLG